LFLMQKNMYLHKKQRKGDNYMLSGISAQGCRKLQGLYLQCLEKEK
jgi:hypothetical protein